MKPGKISETILNRTVFKQMKKRREETVSKPKVGMDAALLKMGDQVLAVSQSTSIGQDIYYGKRIIYSAVNNLYAKGAEPTSLVMSYTLPLRYREERLKKLVSEVEATCDELNIDVVGGHIENSEYVTQPIISVTAIGRSIYETVKARPGMDIVLTKSIGIVSSAVIAHEREEKLSEVFAVPFIDGVKDGFTQMSIREECKKAYESGASIIHNVGKGGILGSLWEVAEECNVGISVDLKKIAVKQEAIEVFEVFDINPYLTPADECAIIITDNGYRLKDELIAMGIGAEVIGSTTIDNKRLVLNEDEVRYLEPPKSNIELDKALRKMIG